MADAPNWVEQAPDPAPAPTPAAPQAPVKLIDKSGRVFDARPDQVAGALADGYEQLSPEDIHRHQIQEEERAKGLEGSVQSGAESFGNQLLGGVPGIIAQHLQTAEENADDQIRAEVHKAARFGGGALGVAGNFAALGGVTGALGDAVAGGAVAPATELANAALGTKLAQKAVALGTQGAALASPAALTQAAFGNPQEGGETLAWGFGLGAVLGASSELLGSAGRTGVRSAAETLEEAVPKEAPVEAAAAAEPVEAPRSVEEATAKYGELRQEAYEKLDAHLEKNAGRETAQHEITPYKLVSSLNELDVAEIKNPLTQEAASASKALLQEAAKLPTVEGRISFVEAQKFADKLAERGDPLSKVAADAVQNEIARSADGIASAQPELAKVLQTAKVQGEEIAQLKAQAAHDAAAKAVADESNLLGALGDGPPPPIVTSGRQGGASGMALGAAIKGGRHLVGTAASAVGHAVAGPVGGYALPKLATGAYDLLTGMSKLWNRPGSGLTVLSPILKQAAAEGPAVFSAVAGAESRRRVAATMTGVHDAMRGLASKGLAGASSTDRSHMGELLGTTSGLSHEQQYAKLTNRLAELQSNPAALAEVAGQVSSPFATTAPEVAQAYQQKISQVVQYLQASVPKAPAPPLPFAPNNWAPTPTDLMAFHDKAQIVANPMKLIQHMQRGTLSDAHMEAAQTIYPAMLSRMRGEVMAFHAKNPGVLLPLAERQSVAKLLGAPLDPTQQPENLVALQASYDQQANGPPHGGQSQRKAPKALKDKQNHASAFSSTMGPPNQETA